VVYPVWHFLRPASQHRRGEVGHPRRGRRHVFGTACGSARGSPTQPVAGAVVEKENRIGE
jgi:hypothetical protein